MPGNTRSPIDVDALAALVRAGDRVALSRAISVVERGGARKRELLRSLYCHGGNAYIVGLTGAPGSGKSSLIDRLLHVIRRRYPRVAVIAVDPSSPFSGGALLGDRIRMQQHDIDPGVFVRSMGSRGHSGGLAAATRDAIRVMDAAGFPIIVIETVGVGQAELDIMNAADTTVVVLTPAGGDGVQSLKAGIMEIADVFAVNKVDLEGSDATIGAVHTMLSLSSRRTGWVPKIVPTVAISDDGIELLWQAVEDHRTAGLTTGDGPLRAASRLEAELIGLVTEMAWRRTSQGIRETPAVRAIYEQVAKRELDPEAAANRILEFVSDQPG